MAVFASLPKLRLIVVDEEHDPSYKSSKGGRYLRLHMPSRIGVASTSATDAPGGHEPPAPQSGVFTAAIKERVGRGEQCMVFLNRRGYALVRADARTQPECKGLIRWAVDVDPPAI
jgi:primosomal protein N' (replication factor Y)